MKTIQESNSGAHRGAVLIEERIICELNESWREEEVNGVAKMLQTDIALELKTTINFMDPFEYLLEGQRTYKRFSGKLWLWSVRVGERS